MLELVHPRLRLTLSLPDPVGQVGAVSQGVRVLGAQHPLAHWQ